MICYSLRCTDDHLFEAWFRSSEAFEQQRGDGALICPVCGDSGVDRALMAPAIASGSVAPAATAITDADPPAPIALDQPKDAKLRALARALHEAVRREASDVGRRFPDEARKIHYGESEPRRIYGEATGGEAKALIEEGIAVLPLPPAPDEQN